jgi:hypothetical protein
MISTSLIRKIRVTGIASAIFAVGAGIGWQVAGVLFQHEPPTPFVAAVQFEGPYRADGRAAISRQGHEAAPVPAPASQQVIDNPQPEPDAIARQAEEERKLADALRWADRYRQRQEAAAWEKVARHQQEMQRLAQAQGEQALTRHGNGAYKLADAGTKLQMGAQIEKAAGQSEPVVKARHVRTHNSAAGRRSAFRPRARSRHVARETIMCPLRWLEVVVVRAAAELRGDRLHHRRSV